MKRIKKRPKGSRYSKISLFQKPDVNILRARFLSENIPPPTVQHVQAEQEELPEQPHVCQIIFHHDFISFLVTSLPNQDYNWKLMCFVYCLNA